MYKYKLKPRLGLQNFVGAGAVLLEGDAEFTEHNNIFVPCKCVGGYILNIPSRTITLYIRTDTKLGDKVSCKYNFKSCKDVWYLNGYDDYSIIDSITIIPESSSEVGDAVAYLVKG